MKPTIEIGGKKLQVVTGDFETFYDTDYSLTSKSLNTSEYIRDDRFHPHGVGLKRGTKKTLWFTGENIRLALHEVDWSKTALLCHNTAFDGFIMSHHYGIVPAFYLDTLSMSRAIRGHHVPHTLDAVAKDFGLLGKIKKASLVNTKGKVVLSPQEIRDLGAYCVDDCNDTFVAFWKMYDHITDEELRLIDMTIRMFCDPVLEVNCERVAAELRREVKGKLDAIESAGVAASDLMSNPKFAELLEKAGATLPMKASPTTGLPAYAFARSDLAFQEMAEQGNPQVKALCEARLKVKSTIGETRAVRFLKAGEDGMKLPVLLNYAGAHTLRWSGVNKMNLQNLLRGGELRRSIRAPRNHVVVVTDSAQIEARKLAYVAGEEWLVEAFRQKRDIYSEFASDVYGRIVDRKKALANERGQYLDKEGQVVERKEDAFFPDALEGFVGKVCILGLGYGMGHIKFDQTLRAGVMGPPVTFEIEECRRIVELYRGRNPNIRAYWRKMDDVIAAMLFGVEGSDGILSWGKGYIKLPNGMFLHYPGLQGIEGMNGRVQDASYLTRRSRSKIYGGLLTENVVQSLARCVVAEQMLKVQDAGYRIVTMSHDEIVVVTHKKNADKCLDDMIKIMRTPPSWAPGLPLDAEGGWDTNYSK